MVTADRRDRVGGPMQSVGGATRLTLTERVATWTAASGVRHSFEAELCAVLPPSLVDDVAAVMGELFIATWRPCHPVDIGVTVTDAAVTVDVQCSVSEPPELEEFAHRLLAGITDVWGVEVHCGVARCWASISLL
jgi:hypothetical protein